MVVVSAASPPCLWANETALGLKLEEGFTGVDQTSSPSPLSPPQE